MGDWVHCNTCFNQPGSSGDARCFFLTGCGHVFCDKCQDKGWKQQCLVCAKPTQAIMKLQADKLSPAAKMFFAEPKKLLLQQLADLKQLIATFQFQDDQRKRLMKWLSNNAASMAEQEKKRAMMFEREIKVLREEIKGLREKNSYLEKLLDERLSEINYFKRLLTEKGSKPNRSHKTGSRIIQSPGHCMRSPTGDMNRNISPVSRAFGHTPSPGSNQHYKSRLSPLGDMNRNISPAQKGFTHIPSSVSQDYSKNMPKSCSSTLSTYRSPGSGSVTQGRVSIRLPPSGGRLGIIPSPQNRTPPTKEFRSTPPSKGFMYTPSSKEFMYTPR